jgi:benzodiazapine receptor
MHIVDEAQDHLAQTLNAQGRSAGHVVTGVAICAALIGVSAALAVARPVPAAPGAEPSRHPWMRAIWPSLFSVTTLAALRVWNAPPNAARRKALAWWGVLQGSNLAMTLWRPRRRSQQLAAATTTAALTAAYAHAASYVDVKAANLTAPTGFAGLASLAATPAR